MEHYLNLCRQSKIIMDTKGVLIRVYRNASGFLWGVEKMDGGTDLGWSEYRGDDLDSGTFTTYEKALEDAVSLVERYGGVEDFRNSGFQPFHWGNYAAWLFQQEDGEEFFPEDTTPKGWVSIEEHLPMWKAVDLMEGGSKYKVKMADGKYGFSTVSDHNVWYYMAKDAGVTHWWNP